MHTKAYHECLQVLMESSRHGSQDCSRHASNDGIFFFYFCITEKLALQEKAVKGVHIKAMNYS